MNDLLTRRALNDFIVGHLANAARPLSLAEVFAQALEILSVNRDILDVAATRLLEVETLDEAALRELTRDLRRPEPALAQ